MTDKTVKLLRPALPNFISVQAPWNIGTKAYAELPAIDIADLSDEELTAIADEWRVALLKHAEHRRAERKGKAVLRG